MSAAAAHIGPGESLRRRRILPREYARLLGVTVWSIGHSTHSRERFAELLRGHAIELLADIRRAPRSRRHRQFDTDRLAEWLPEAGIEYRHLPRLAGWRRPLPDSPNAGWRNESFRGYADYALTEEFAAGLAELLQIARERRTAMMCSEALWWRCHRRLVADRLVAQGIEVVHIASDGRGAPHRLTRFGVAGPDGRVTYPG